MTNIDQTHALQLLKGSLGIAAHVATTTPVNMKLCTTTPTATAAATEVANAGGSTYAAKRVDNVLTATAGNPAQNNTQLDYTNMPGSTTVTAVELWDSAGTPARKWFGTIANKTTNLGDTLSFAVNQLSIALA